MSFTLDNPLSGGFEDIYNGPKSQRFTQGQANAYSEARSRAIDFLNTTANVQANKVAAKAEQKYQEQLAKSQQKSGLFGSLLSGGLSLGLKAITGGLA